MIPGAAKDVKRNDATGDAIGDFGGPAAAKEVGRNDATGVRLGDLAQIAQLAENGEVTMDLLIAVGAVRANRGPAKVLSNGEIDAAVTVRGLKVSEGARAKIEAAGGRVEE